METELLGGEADDQDFDMFLNNNEQEEQGPAKDEPKEPTPPPVEMTPADKLAAFNAQSPVWIGTVSLPLLPVSPHSASDLVSCP